MLFIIQIVSYIQKAPHGALNHGLDLELKLMLSSQSFNEQYSR